VFAGVAGDAYGAYDFAGDEDGDAAFDGYCAFDFEDAQAQAATGESVLKGFGGALEANGGAGFGDAELGAGELGVVHLFVINEIAGVVDDGDGHGPVVFLGFGDGGSGEFFGVVDGDGWAVGVGHLRSGGNCGEEKSEREEEEFAHGITLLGGFCAGDGSRDWALGGGGGGGEGEGDADGGAVVGVCGGAGVDVDLAVELEDAFAHAAETYAAALGLELHQFFGGDALAFVVDFENNAIDFMTEANGGAFAAGMAMHVGEAFLDDAENGQLGLAREAAEIIGDIDRNIEAAAFVEAASVPGDGFAEAAFVEKRRMEKIRGGANFLAKFSNEFGAVFGFAGENGIDLAGEADDAGEVHAQSSEILAGAVVEFAGDVAAFFVLHLHESLGKLAKQAGLLENFGVAKLEEFGAGTDLLLESGGESAIFFLGVF